jgi:hypothetical protein
MSGKRFYPDKIAEFLIWGANFTAQTEAFATALGIPAPERLHTGILEAIRRVKNGYVDPAFTLGKLTPENYLAFGLSLPDTTHTPKGDPTDLVDFDISLLSPDHRVIVHYVIAGSGKRGKGDYQGAEARYRIRPLAEEGPRGPNDAGWHSEVDTASPREWTAAESGDYGKRLFIALRRENPSSGAPNKATGKGPWSAIRSVIIP